MKILEMQPDFLMLKLMNYKKKRLHLAIAFFIQNMVRFAPSS